MRRGYTKVVLGEVHMNKKVMAAALLAAYGNTAQALELPSNGYVRGSVGMSQYDMSVDEQGIGMSLGEGTAFSLAGGIELARFISVEAGYYNFGEVSDSVYNGPGNLEVNRVTSELERDVDIRLSSFGAALRLHTDSSLALHAGGMLGYHRWNSKAEGVLREELQFLLYDPNTDTEFVEVISQGGPFSTEDSGSGVYGGVFAAWNSPFGEIGVEYTLFDVDGNKPSITAASYTYRF